MFNLKNSEFITSATTQNEYPHLGPPEIAFAGQSNVGKSSLINTLVQNKKLVKTSSTPGRTQQINFFSIKYDQLRFIDLPGYGFAKTSQKMKLMWKQMIETYLLKRISLIAVVVILDIRRNFSHGDKQLTSFLHNYRIPIIIVLTKTDKLSNNQRFSQLNKVDPILKKIDPNFIIFSSINGTGRVILLNRLKSLFIF